MPTCTSPTAAAPEKAGHAAHWRRTATTVRRFHVSITRADGTATNEVRTGGTTFEHISAAEDEAGLGGVFRVVPLRLAEAA